MYYYPPQLDQTSKPKAPDIIATLVAIATGLVFYFSGAIFVLPFINTDFNLSKWYFYIFETAYLVIIFFSIVGLCLALRYKQRGYRYTGAIITYTIVIIIAIILFLAPFLLLMILFQLLQS